MAERPDLPHAWVERLREILDVFPECQEDGAWVGLRWRVGDATVAHAFGGEDQRFRITFRADPDEVVAFMHLGTPYFRCDWGRDVVGLFLDEETDWEELGELLTDSYCIQAPARLADLVERPA